MRLATRKQRAQFALNALRFSAILVSLCLAVLPLYWMLHEAVQSAAYRFVLPPSLLPRDPTTSGLISVLSGDGPHWLLNTLVVAVGTALLALAIGAWGAYALSRFTDRGLGAAAYIVLSTQFMPPAVLMIPMFRILVYLKLDDSLPGLVLADLVFTLPITTWILKSIFDAIPVDFEEAAMVDGCNRMLALWHVVLPITLPGIIAAGIFAFLESWGEFMFTRTVISDPSNWVGSIGIASFLSEYGPRWDQVMATAVVFTLPPVILFLSVQKYFVAALQGGVKG